jgi:hypothetical protein
LFFTINHLAQILLDGLALDLVVVYEKEYGSLTEKALLAAFRDTLQQLDQLGKISMGVVALGETEFKYFWGKNGLSCRWSKEVVIPL